MTVRTTETKTGPGRRLRSAAAVSLGFVLTVVLHVGTDQVFHALEVYPPWGEPMRDPGLNALALSYRIAFSVVGAYVTAWLAPHAPVRHALALGAIGLVLSAAGAIAAIPRDLGPAWYPIALVVVALPCAWLGGVLFRARRAGR